MMNPVIPTNGTGGGPAYDDTAIVERIATAEDDISTLKSGKATTQSVATAKARADDAYALADMLDGYLSAPVIRVPEDFATLNAACTAARALRKYDGPLPRIDIAAGTYDENPVIHGCMLVARTPAPEFTPTAVSQVFLPGNTSKDITFTGTAPQLAAYAVGDAVFVRVTNVQVDTGQGFVATSARVVSRTTTTVTLRYFYESNASNPVLANVRVSRPTVQIGITAAIVLPFATDTWIRGGIGIRPTVASVSPTVMGGGYFLIRLHGATLRLGVLSEAYALPDLVMAGCAGGVTLTRGSFIFGGHLAVGNQSYAGVECVDGGVIKIDRFSASCFGDNGHAMFLAEGSNATIRSQYLDANSAGFVYSTYYAFRVTGTSRLTLVKFDVFQNYYDVYVDLDSHVGILAGTRLGSNNRTSPAVNTVGNRNSYIGA